MSAVGRLCLCALLAALLPSCKRGSEDATTPTPANATAASPGPQNGDGDAAEAESMWDEASAQPAGDQEVAMNEAAPESAPAADEADEGPGEAAPAPQSAAAIEPPTLDKRPEEIKRLVDTHMRAGIDAMRSARPDDAIVEARRVLAENEVYVPGMVLLAHAYYAKGYYDKAEAILDIAVKRPDGPESARLHYLYGLVYDKTDRPDQALAAFEQAVQVNPQYKNGLLNLGAKYLERKRFADAVKVYETLTSSLGDTRPMVWNNLGSAYRGLSIDPNPNADRVDALRKAEAAYKRATTEDKNYADAYYNLGVLYLDAENFPEPGGTEKMDTLLRLERARTYFRQYRGMPGANHELVDQQVAVADKLVAREEKRREAEKKREERQRQREQRARERQQRQGNGEN